jgi:hypothetical protein
MASRDLHDNIFVYNALNTSTIATDTTTNGNIIDTQAFESVEFVIQSGTVTDGTFTPSIQEGDESNLSDAETATDLIPESGAATAATFVAANDNAVRRLGYIGGKRYVRLRLASTGTTSGGVFSATAILGHPQNMPTDNN